jgi:hypothetical protein
MLTARPLLASSRVSAQGGAMALVLHTHAVRAMVPGAGAGPQGVALSAR